MSMMKAVHFLMRVLKTAAPEKTLGKSEYTEAIKPTDFYSNSLKIKYGISVWSKLQINYEC